MKKLVAAIVVVVVVAGLVIGGALLRPKEKAIIRVGYLPITACMYYFVGEQQGYFESQGLEIKPVRFESSQQEMDALLQGRIDVASSVAATVGLIVQEKSPDQFKVFGLNANGVDNPLDVLIVKADSKIQTIQGLKGKKIGSFPGVQALTLLKRYLRTNGLDPDRDVQIQEMKQDLHLAALDSGQVDAVLTYEPNVTIAEQKGISRILVKAPLAQASANPGPTGVFAISAKYLSSHPKDAQKLVTAFNQSIDYSNRNQPEARKVLSKFAAIDQDIAAKVPLPHFETVASMDKRSFQKFADVLYKEKVLKKQPDINAFLLR